MLKIESNEDDPFMFDVTVEDQGEESTQTVDRFHAISTVINFIGEMTRREFDEGESSEDQ